MRRSALLLVLFSIGAVLSARLERQGVDGAGLLATLFAIGVLVTFGFRLSARHLKRNGPGH